MPRATTPQLLLTRSTLPLFVPVIFFIKLYTLRRWFKNTYAEVLRKAMKSIKVLGNLTIESVLSGSVEQLWGVLRDVSFCFIWTWEAFFLICSL